METCDLPNKDLLQGRIESPTRHRTIAKAAISNTLADTLDLDDTLDLEQPPDDNLRPTPNSKGQSPEEILRQVSSALDALSKDKPYTARHLSHLQSLDQVIQGSTASSVDKINETMRIQDLSLEALPDRTSKALATRSDGSRLALELVRRNLTEFDSLAHTLFSSTEKQRNDDAGLSDLYSALSPAIEVHGALMNAGIDVGSRDWAAIFAEKMPNLRRLKSTPWHEVAILLKLIHVETEAPCDPVVETKWKNPPSREEIRIVQQVYANCEGAPAIRKQVLSVRLGLDVADQLEEMGIYDANEIATEDTRRLADLAMRQLDDTNDDTTQKTKYTPATAPTSADGDSSVIAKIKWKQSSPTKLVNLRGKADVGELVNKLNALASNASASTGMVPDEKVPDVDAAVAGLFQEKARLQEAMETVRKQLDSVNVTGNVEEGLKNVKNALDAAKAAVVPNEGWQSRIDPGAADAMQTSLQARRLTLGKSDTGYSSNEELVARASGGAALYGLNIFPRTDDMMLKPYTPVLETPTHVQMTGAVANFEAHVWQTTDVEAASSFHSVSDSAGTSVAQKVANSVGGSVRVSTLWGAASLSSGLSNEAENDASEMKSTDEKTSSSSTSSSATVVEYIMCPMKSFRIPASRMRLSEGAYKSALEIDSIHDAEEFLDAFGSHVSNGRQEMGGIFYSTMVMTSSKEVDSSSLLEAASKQANDTKTHSTSFEASVGAGYGPASGKVSSSFGKATSVGVAMVNTSASGQGSHSEAVNARYSQYIRCTGPRATTPEIFAETLFDDNSSWAVIDRGPIEAFIPVSRVLQNTIELMNDDDSDKARIQMAMYYIAAAWRNRAKNWASKRGFVIPHAILSVYQTACPVSQERVQRMTDSVYGVLEFVKCENFEEAWSCRMAKTPSAEEIGLKVAKAIVTAAQNVSGGRGVPVLLQHLSPEEVRGYVESVMARKQQANGQEILDAAYLKTLPEWEQRWIEKTRQKANEDKEWTDEDYVLFQREHFKAATPLKFHKQLDKELDFLKTGFFSIRVTSLKRSGVKEEGSPTLEKYKIEGEKTKTKELREAVKKAAYALTGEDWTMFHKIWTTSESEEETRRVTKIIQKYIDAAEANSNEIKNRTWLKPAKKLVRAEKVNVDDSNVVSKADFKPDFTYRIASADGSFVLSAAGKEKKVIHHEELEKARARMASNPQPSDPSGQEAPTGGLGNLVARVLCQPHQRSEVAPLTQDLDSYARQEVEVQLADGGLEGFRLLFLNASRAEGGSASSFTFSRSRDSSCGPSYRIHSSEHGNNMLFFLGYPRELVVWTVDTIPTDGLWEVFKLLWSDDGNTFKIRHGKLFVQCKFAECEEGRESSVGSTPHECEATEFRLQKI